jgi:predicted TIM-barrel fold metal-dependent hydrolase
MVFPTVALAQSLDEVPTIRTFNPSSTLEVVKTNLTAAKFPVIDVHNHFGFKYRGNSQRLDEYVAIMDRNNIAASISFDAPLGHEDDHIAFLAPHAERVPFFVHLDFVRSKNKSDPKTFAVNQPGFVRQKVENLTVAKQRGALGLKLFKSFGLTVQDRNGSLIKIDDPQFDPIWKRCGELGLPVIIHSADPVAFFNPTDNKNERWEELNRHPDWSFHGDKFPSRESLLEARNHVIARHPKTTFIGAHVANNSEDLAAVGKWLDEYPNLVVEIASRINELGRQPYTARKFFIKYQDRIMFGTDGPWGEERLRYYWRFLETYDEYFPYSEKSPPPQGSWRIYGIGLPDEVLKKVYSENAIRIMPELKTALPGVTREEFKPLLDLID